VNKNTANLIYNVLVRYGGAIEDMRDSFVSYCTREREVGRGEFKFFGLFDSGKFWFGRDGRYVTYYPEDKTPEREAALAKIKFALQPLQEDFDGKPRIFLSLTGTFSSLYRGKVTPLEIGTEGAVFAFGCKSDHALVEKGFVPNEVTWENEVKPKVWDNHLAPVEAVDPGPLATWEFLNTHIKESHKRNRVLFLKDRDDEGYGFFRDECLALGYDVFHRSRWCQPGDQD
jgi:hypothetical protein